MTAPRIVSSVLAGSFAVVVMVAAPSFAQVVLPFGSTYQYRFVAPYTRWDSLSNVGSNEPGWLNGPAPFGDASTSCAFLPATTWPPQYWILLQTEFWLPDDYESTQFLSLGFTYVTYNKIDLRINDRYLTKDGDDWCTDFGNTGGVHPSELRPGKNTLIMLVRSYDHSIFDLTMYWISSTPTLSSSWGSLKLIYR